MIFIKIYIPFYCILLFYCIEFALEGDIRESILDQQTSVIVGVSVGAFALLLLILLVVLIAIICCCYKR